MKYKTLEPILALSWISTFFYLIWAHDLKSLAILLMSAGTVIAISKPVNQD